MIKITGGVDVNKLLDDVNTGADQDARPRGPGHAEPALAADGGAEKQVTDAIKDPKVEIYTGKDDKILRRMVVALGIVAPKSSSSPNGSADFKLDFSISDLNEDQEISEPSSAKPFDQLASQLGGLGLGGLGGSGASGSSGSGLGLRQAEQREPREVLQVRERRRQRHRQGAQVRRPAHALA